MKVRSNLFRKLYLPILVSLSMLWGAAPAHAQGTPTNSARNGPYSLLEVLTLSAFGGEVPAFTRLSIFDFR